ncbi:MAG: alpha/beta hydrolase [Chloroflexota bacterium]
MQLDPQVRWLVDQVATLNLPPNDQLSPADARANAVQRACFLKGVPIKMGRIEDRVIPGPERPLAVRIYWPQGEEAARPVMMFYHGGGWVICDIETHDHVCRALARESGAIVVSVSYRLAPENQYPAAAEDCYAALEWAAANAESLGGDPLRLGVAGDSAGGNLSAVVAQMARDRSGPRLGIQVLIYPVTNYGFETPSYEENGEAPMLTRADMVWFWNHYLGDPARGAEPYASPLRAEDCSGLAPALVITAQYDPLRDEGRAYAERLRSAGVPAHYSEYPGQVHAFVSRWYVLDAGKAAIKEAGQAIKQALR